MLLRYALIALALIAPTWQNDAAIKSSEWGPRSGPWRLSIAAEQSHYVVGETVSVTAVLKNISDAPVMFTSPGSATLYVMDVRLPVPEWIPWKPRAAALGELPRDYSFISINVPPGYEHVSSHKLSKLFNMATPGEYRVVFSTQEPAHTMNERKDAREKTAVKVTSNELTITVSPSTK
jgi:hypothetical protein